jgi:hypothetical protein
VHRTGYVALVTLGAWPAFGGGQFRPSATAARAKFLTSPHTAHDVYGFDRKSGGAKAAPRPRGLAAQPAQIPLDLFRVTALRS